MVVRVLALDPIHEAGLALLKARRDVELIHLLEPTAESIDREMVSAEALILRGRRLPSEAFEKAKRLKIVSRHGVGCDNLDLPQLEARGIAVAVSADANLVSVAEHAFALMLAAAKNLVVADRAVREGDFARRGAMGACEIAGRVVLVVGFGRIGRAFAERAAAFGATVRVSDPFLPADAEFPFERVFDLDEALGGADVVSLHVPLASETARFFDAHKLARMKHGAILVNTARGGIVDEPALVEALDARRPAFYATDVLAEEPPAADNPLLGRADVILSPHSAAMTAEGVERMATGAAQNVLDFIDGCLDSRMTVLAPSDRA